jgi:uncharacterized protein YbaP (TraB family)
MRRRLVAGMAACVMTGLVFAAEPPPAAPLEELDTVLVTGIQSGPALWKVSKGDHVLWILGTYSPLPQKMTWNSAEAAMHLASSQEILFPGGVRTDLDVGFFTSLSSLNLMRKAGSNPDEETLQDVLPPDVFDKWRVLQEKYMPRDTVARMRPPFAMQSLQNNAFIRIGFGGDAGIDKEIRKLARKHKLKVTAIPVREVELKVKGARELLKKYSSSPLAGVDCFARAVDLFEATYATLTDRANAWAAGDIASFRQLRDKQLAPNCVSEMTNALLTEGFERGTVMEAVVERYKKDLDSAWKQQVEVLLRSTESALTRNKSTFAVMRIESLLQPDGYPKYMRDRGYLVEAPDER